MEPEQIPLSDEQLAWIAANAPERINDLNSEERRRLTRLRGQSELGPADTSMTTRVRGTGARFLEPILQAPVDMWNFASGMVTSPMETAKSVLDASVNQLQMAQRAAQEGRPLASSARIAAAVPIVGPAVANIVDTAQDGNYAGAAGQATVLAAPGVLRAGRAAVSAGTDAALAAGRRVAPRAMDARAAALDASANERMAKFIAPQTGPNKGRLSNQAMKVAPEILRDPEMGAMSRGGLSTKIGERLDAATASMDEAADARLASQQVRTAPLVAKLDAEIAKLQATPVEGSRLIPQYAEYAEPVRAARPDTEVTVKPPSAFTADDMSRHQRGYRTLNDGSFASEPPRQGRPIGQTVEPRPNSPQLETLRQIRREVAALGDVAPYESIRRIRQAWDQVAKVKYMPSTAADALKAQGDATAAMRATGAMREALAEVDPKSAAAYKQYSVYKAAQDVLDATEEAERVRPNRGRGMMRNLTATQGVTGAVIAIADKAADMAPTFQVVIARRLAATADLLRRGKVAEAQAVVDRTVAQFPRVRGGVRATMQASPTLGRVAELGRVPMAATAEEPDR